MEALPQNPLAPLYYRDNFLRLCDTVRSQYGDILTEPECAFWQRFDSVSVPAQCLYIRLISRAGPWFRTSKLQYAEIPDLAAALGELQDAQIAIEADALTVDELAALYTRPELEQIFRSQLAADSGAQSEMVRAANKGDLIMAIETLGLSEQELRRQSARLDPEKIVALAGAEHVALFQVLFFGNRHQSLTEFVLEDLGVRRFFPYQLHPEHRFFSCREAVDEYLACATLADARYELLENEEHAGLLELANDLAEVDIQFDSSRARWDKLCNRLARDLERLGAFDEALALYTRSQSHPARERSARILEKTEQLESAHELCRQILQNPLTEAEHEAAEKILPRVRRKLDGTRTTRRRRDTFGELHLDIARQQKAVELCAADHLNNQWKAVHYVENSLMNALFGLAFWDIIFADEPGVFHHPFQSAPADMYEGSFSRRRASAISERLQTMATAELPQMLCSAYRQFQGYHNRWVDWRYISEPLVSQAASIIPNAHLTSIWERILFDPRENRRGFPDLIALGEARGDYRLIEVKGPGDTLQDNQKRWLRFFAEHGIPAEVAWVTWAQVPDIDD